MESSLCEKPERHASRRLSDHLTFEGQNQKVHSLVDKVYSRENLRLAWERVRANRGASGADRVTIGDFERVDVPDRSVDAVFSATAYHWLTPAAQLDRPATILKPGGVMAIVDLNQVDSSDDDGFFDAVQPIYERYGQGHTGPPAPECTSVNPAIRQSLGEDRRFIHVEVHSYDWNQTYTASGYRKLMLSYSVTQMMNPGDRKGLLDEVEAFIRERFSGQITRPLVVTLTTATLV